MVTNMFKIGDIVTRKKYGNDIIFKIDKIEGNKVYLKGLELRLYADSNVDDIVLCTIPKKKESNEILRELKTEEFFYLPGTILHIDSDKEYLDKCLEYYKKQKIKAIGYLIKEKELESKIEDIVKNNNMNILVITGHDAYYKNKKNGKYYKNSEYYINSVKKARNIKRDHNDLVIIAGACQSDFEGLITSGATYASSPKHINIHALDPAIIAVYIALSEKNNSINIEDMLQKTKYGKDGIGGLKICGMMLKGYPRKE